MFRNDYKVIEPLEIIGANKLHTVECSIVENRNGVEMFDIALYTIGDHERRVHIALYPDQFERLRNLLNEISIIDRGTISRQAHTVSSGSSED